MLRAAYELVCESGYEAATMNAIAERAGVAVQTLYFTFGNKAAILGEVLHAAVVGFDRWTPTLDRDVHADHEATAREAIPWFRAFEEEPDPRRALELFVAGTAEISARVGPLLVRLGPQHGTEIEETLAASERLREEACEMVIRAVARKGAGLRPSLTIRQAVDVFFVLTGAELFHAVTVGRGWPVPRAKRWLGQLLAEQLLAEPRT